MHFADTEPHLLWLVRAYSLLLLATPSEFYLRTTTIFGGRLAAMPNIASLVSTIILIVIVLKSKTTLYVKMAIPSVLYYMMIGIWYRFGVSGTPGIQQLLLGFQVYLIMNLSIELKRIILITLCELFAIVMTPGLIFFIIRYFDLPFPHTIEYSTTNLLKQQAGIAYEAFPLGVLRITRGTPDYCGMYDEAGCLGTHAALLYTAIDAMGCNALNTSWRLKYARIGVIVEAIMSFSFAAYLILFVYIIVKAIYQHNLRSIAIIASVIAAVVFLQGITTDNTMMTRLQQRSSAILLQLGVDVDADASIRLDNRMSDEAMAIIQRWQSDDSVIVKLFGYGPTAYSNASSGVVDGSSILIYFYNYGYVGVILYYIVIAINSLYLKRRTVLLYAAIVVFILSTYQRPGVMSLLYMIPMVSIIPYKNEKIVLDKNIDIT